MSSEPSTAEPMAVWVRIQGRDFLWTQEEGLDPAVVSTVENWIWKRARSLSRAAAMGGLAVEDLVQEGRIGALKAARTYEPGHAANFLSWAVLWIRKAMLDALDSSGDITFPRDLRRQFRRDGQHPPVFSLDASVNGEETWNASWMARLAAAPEPMDELGQRARNALWVALGSLRPRDREVLLRRYGFRGEPETLEAIGSEWGLSRQRIAQIESRAKLRLRAALSQQPTPPVLRPKNGSAMPAYTRTLTITDSIREEARKAQAEAKAARQHRKHLRQAAAGTPLFHLSPEGRMDLRQPCPDCDPAGSGLYQGRVCECCGGAGVVEPMP